MKIQALGHVVLKVRDRARAEAFYTDVLGLPVVAHLETPPMAFFSLGNHHDFAVMAVGEDAAAVEELGVGLAHVAFKIGDDMATLRQAKADLEAAGVTVTPVDHGVTRSLYFDDPDGNCLEVYVDVSDAWRRDRSKVAQYTPLEM